jgi:hypothetical protein
MQVAMGNTFVRVLGFLIGAAGVAAVEFGIIGGLDAATDREWLPRGPGWLVVPVVAGLALSRYLPGLLARLKAGDHPLIQRFWASPPWVRLAVLVPLFWLVVVSAYVFVFSPYGEYMGDEDWDHLLKVIAFPPAVFIAALVAYRKLMVRKTSVSAGQPGSPSD